MITKNVRRVEVWEISDEAWHWLIQTHLDAADILEFTTEDDFYKELYWQWENVDAPEDEEVFIELYRIIDLLDFTYGGTDEFKISWQAEKGAKQIVSDREDV